MRRYWTRLTRATKDTIIVDGKLFVFAYLHGKRKWYVQVPWTYVSRTTKEK